MTYNVLLPLNCNVGVVVEVKAVADIDIQYTPSCLKFMYACK